MNVTCPKCETTFSLPEELYAPGRKVRCSICKNVFPLPGPEEIETGPEEPSATKSKRSSWSFLFLALAIIACLAGIGFGGYMIYSTLVSRAFNTAPSVDEPRALTQDEHEQLLKQREKVSQIFLKDVRQYIVANEILGEIVVIQGIVVNNFSTPKERITVEGLLYDTGGNVLANQVQVAGPTLSLLQLQVFTEKEFTKTLSDKVAILTRNVDVPSKGEVPFVIVFSKKPAALAEFEVRPIDVSDPHEAR